MRPSYGARNDRDVTGNWSGVFHRWATQTPRRGVLVVGFGEQIPFSGFSISEGFLLVERQSPDSMGTRTVMLPYDQIRALKIVDVVKGSVFQSFGFDLPKPKQVL